MVGRQLRGARIAAGVRPAHRPALCNHHREQAGQRRTNVDPVQMRMCPTRDDPPHDSVVPLDQSERDVRCSEELASRVADGLEQLLSVTLGGELEPDVDQRSQPGVRLLEIADIL